MNDNDHKLDIAEAMKVIKETETIKEVDGTLALIARGARATLLPLEIWVTKREYSREIIRKKLNEKLKDVNQKDISAPELYIAKPILDSVDICIDCNELREMYSNLLAKSMYSFTKKDVHPSFVDLIRNLSPDEARIIEAIKGEDIPVFSMRYLESSKNSYAKKRHNYYYYCKLNLQYKKCSFCEYEDLEQIENFQDDLGEELFNHLVDSDTFECCQFNDKLDFYLDNLQRLKLIEINFTSRLTKAKYNSIVEKDNFAQKILTKIDKPLIYNDDVYLGVNLGYIRFSNFGEEFYKSCCTEIAAH